MDFDEFWRFFWILMDFLVHSIYYYLVWVCSCVCLSVRPSFDRFWQNDKFQFLGFRIFWGHFLSRFLPNSLKNHWKVDFSLVFSCSPIDRSSLVAKFQQLSWYWIPKSGRSSYSNLCSGNRRKTWRLNKRFGWKKIR